MEVGNGVSERGDTCSSQAQSGQGRPGTQTPVSWYRAEPTGYLWTQVPETGFLTPIQSFAFQSFHRAIFRMCRIQGTAWSFISENWKGRDSGKREQTRTALPLLLIIGQPLLFSPQSSRLRGTGSLSPALFLPEPFRLPFCGLISSLHLPPVAQ